MCTDFYVSKSLKKKINACMGHDICLKKSVISANLYIVKNSVLANSSERIFNPMRITGLMIHNCTSVPQLNCFTIQKKKTLVGQRLRPYSAK